MCMIRLPSPSSSTTLPFRRAAATPIAIEMELPMAPNSRSTWNCSGLRPRMWVWK